MTRRFRFSALGVVFAGVLMALVGAAPALAQSPWWHLTAGARPSYLSPSAPAPQNEVQQLTVSATSGDFFLRANEKAVYLPYDATHETLQKSLEGVYGAGDVEVSGGPGDEQGTKPYVITFTGADGARPVELIQASSFPFIPLKGGRAEASVSELTPGRFGQQIVLSATNLGDGNVDGQAKPVTIDDTLPAGLKADAIEGVVRGALQGQPATTPVDCSLTPLHCSYSGTLYPYQDIEVLVSVALQPSASSGEVNQASVAGGQAAGATVARPITVSDAEPPFAVEEYALTPEEAGGALDTQAGSHPFQLTSTLTLNQTFETSGKFARRLPKPAALAKDLNFKLPPGLIGNPTPFPRCTLEQFLTVINGAKEDECAPDTAVGVAMVTVNEPGIVGLQTFTMPLFNLEPSVGEPARFGFFVDGIVPVLLDTSVRTGGDYGVTVSVKNISQIAGFLSSQVTFWGVPGDERHDNARGYGCLAEDRGSEGYAPCPVPGAIHPPPLLALPTSCTGPLASSVEADSWAQAGSFKSFPSIEPLPSLDGCNRLPFSPSISVAPDSEDASSPSGLTVDVHVPQEQSLSPEGLAESDVRDTTVELPRGVAVNPGGGDGLEACSEGQIGYLGHESSTEVAAEAFSPTLPNPFCSQAAKLGTVEITTPLLPNPLTGAVYLASPAPQGEAGQNPFRTLLAMYIVAEDPVSGTLVKLPGKVELNEKTGQLVSSFEDTPQLPFEDLSLHFFGGGRAPLATPGLCGAYTTKALFTPWSGNPPVQAASTFDITAGPNGSPCPSNPRPFAPEFQAGSTNIQAGGFTELLTTMGHPDADQTLGGLSIKLPPGLSGLLSSVKLCGEAQANAGTCGPESLIGHTVVTAGLGSTPVVVKRPGDVYITGPTLLEGPNQSVAPFGLSIVNPAEAGPFNLGNVIVRAKIEVNPTTAALTITSDPLPTIIKGIPLDIQHVQVAISKEVNGGKDFTFNPTSCAAQKIEGTISSSEGATAPVSSAFQATNCASLKFAPKFSVSTSGKTSKAEGASLTAKLSEPNEPQGSQANIARVKVDLPRQLPSRLTTLQKACTVAQFEANPAACPAESKIGYAKVITPLLPVPLEGPAIFVSHGGEAFPSLTLVLQGDNVTLDLVGTTFISKAGITSTTFKTVPDQPFNTFSLTLPEGKYSALAANGNLCAQKLAMPTEFVGQNGAQIHESTKIAVTGCAKAKKLTRAQKLKAALKVCHKKKSKAKRAKCQKAARKKYGPLAKKKKKAKKH